MKQLCLLVALAAISAAAFGANTPCSGKKGGVSHCAGPTFVCNDGSVSASKRICSAAGKDLRALSLKAADDEERGGATCTCRSHQYCTGPRGGQYCFTDSGNKSYRRR